MMNDKLEQLQKYLEKMEQFNHQCHLVSNQDMLDLLLDSALVMLLLP